MTNDEFRSWLKGFFELSEGDALISAKQAQVVINHLNLAEAVEGSLDTVNEQLRADFDLYRQDDKTPQEQTEFSRDVKSRLGL